MRQSQVIQLLAAGVVVSIGGCGPDESAIVSRGKASIPFAAQFDRLFPNASHFLTGNVEKLGWNSKTGLYGRYIITLQIPISAKGYDVVTLADPQFFITEIAEIVEYPNGQVALITGGLSKQFGIDVWKRIVEAHGEIDKVFFGIKRNDPVPLFDKYWLSG